MNFVSTGGEPYGGWGLGTRGWGLGTGERIGCFAPFAKIAPI